MKLRLRGNSLRLRLDRTEIAALGSGDRVVDICRFGPDPGNRLSCFIEVAEQETPLRATFHHGAISVYLSVKEAKSLIESDKVGVSATQDTGDGNELRLTLEKDFQCLAPRVGEDDSQAFDNPRKAHDCDS